MRYTLVLILCCCATQGLPAPAPEDMPTGRIICSALCGSYNRDYVEYRYDGKCVCGPAKK